MIRPIVQELPYSSAGVVTVVLLPVFSFLSCRHTPLLVVAAAHRNLICFQRKSANKCVVVVLATIA